MSTVNWGDFVQLFHVYQCISLGNLKIFYLSINFIGGTYVKCSNNEIAKLWVTSNLLLLTYILGQSYLYLGVELSH